MMRPLTLIRHVITSVVREGDFAVDATIGNGHDTELLARLVGQGGCVLGIDMQKTALVATSARLCDSGLQDRVVLVQSGHERLREAIREMGQPLSARCVMFNLGYQPGGDKQLVTRPETTVKALREACHILIAGGVISVMVYPNHAGGAEEAAAVAQVLQELESEGFVVSRYGNACFITRGEGGLLSW